MFQSGKFKGIVLPKMGFKGIGLVHASFPHLHVIPNLYGFLSPVQLKEKIYSSLYGQKLEIFLKKMFVFCVRKKG